MFSHEIGEEKVLYKGYGDRLLRSDDIDSWSHDWIFCRIVPAGDTVIACFHHVAEAPSEEIQIPLRREEAVKFAKAILG